MAPGGDGAPIYPVYLVERQRRIALEVVKGEVDVDELASRLGVKREDLMRDLEELRHKGLIAVERVEQRRLVLTEEGERYVLEGTPERRVLEALKRAGRLRRGELARVAEQLGLRLSAEEAEIGLAQLAAAGALRFEDDYVELSNPEAAESRVRAVEEALRGIAQGLGAPEAVVPLLKRRRLVEARRRASMRVRPTDHLRQLVERGLLGEAWVVTELTPELIASGEWRNVVFKPFDLSAEPPTPTFGRRHPYLEFLDYVREILVSMGFEEMKGPHVELELWNFDALFQAQDHPAREIHDTYFVKGGLLGRFGDAELMRRIARVHEDGWDTGSRGWGYKWDPVRALRLILRTQTTAVSARTLYARGEGEYMCFSLDRVFRPENLDAKHSMEFYQLEGIIVGRNVTFRHLLGFFHEMARRLNLGEVKVKPAYFPFTEPSVEGFIKHPKLGWIEVFPGGMFRPEMLRALGLRDVNVAAWGIGIDRIAMTVLGVDDIRLLFARDLAFLRSVPRPIPESMVG
ncbi:MAG: phenylalanine--tRNA ligase subunit alpha [Thermofilum sp.]|nr:phenylalanine--tRNA ligase subunit alpha [Thermofilum sp.]